MASSLCHSFKHCLQRRHLIALERPIRAVAAAGQPRVQVKAGDRSETFDAAVLAVHSDTALRLRGPDATDLEKAVLAALPYNDNTVYLHTGVLHRVLH